MILLKIGEKNNEICENLILRDHIGKDIELLNKDFSQWEKIKKFELTPDVWNIEDGHLTPTMKVKRKVIIEKYNNLIEKIYS